MVNYATVWLMLFSWLNCVSKKNSTYLLDLEKRKVERFIEKCEKDWEISAGEVRNLRRSYQLALQRLERFEEAASAMEQLLGLYEEAEQTCADAVQDGHSCILQVCVRTIPHRIRRTVPNNYIPNVRY